ncbi:hypothetical protein T484DRAFT_3050875 [Baffinella frigidus]|nr:hypothetical protein T484DRAFT_3050875 [Cryptophyta sp. CCMP2293]
MRKSGAAGGPNEALLGDGAARKLTNEALRVLAEDLEESLGDASAAVASSRGQDKATKALAQAGELLEQLRSQGRTGSRQDQVACDILVKRYQRSIAELAERHTASENSAGGAAGGASDEERKKWAKEALKHAGRTQKDSEASLARSTQIVEQTERLGQETAVVLKSQTEQMKRSSPAPLSTAAPVNLASAALVNLDTSLNSFRCSLHCHTRLPMRTE